MKPGEVLKGSATALVTGGNSGIGRCYACRLAALGYNLILVGQSEERNEETAKEIRQTYGVKVKNFVQDLATPTAGRELYERIKEAGVEIRVLINNAGTFCYNDVLKCDLERLERILYLHAMTTMTLCRLFGEEMAARGEGYILNMASYSLWMPWPGLSTYSASKNFVRAFSMGFAKEVRERGVKVTAISPAGVATDLYGLPHDWQRFGMRIGVLLSADSCARRALKALWRGRRSSVPGWWNRLGIPFCLYMPMWVLKIARKYTLQFQK